MSHPVSIENDALRLEVWPQIGGKVSSLVDKSDGFDLLFSYPDELPQGSQYDIPYSNSWYAGWDECFPAIAPSNYPVHPYSGVAVPDHGELWGLPTTAVPARDGITTVWHGLRFGYRLTRKLYLEQSSVVAEYTLINLAPFEFRFVWALHALLSLPPGIEIDPGPATQFRLSHTHDGKEIKELHQPFEWPRAAGGELDLSKPDSLPTRRGWKAYSVNPILHPLTVRYPARHRQVRIEYTSEDALPAYWGIWINTGGWNAHRHFAIEPTTGRFDQIDRSIRDDSAGRVPPSGRQSWAVRWLIS